MLTPCNKTLKHFTAFLPMFYFTCNSGVRTCKVVVGGPAGPAMAGPLFLPRNFFLLFFATIGEIFSLKFTKYCSAVGLCPDPLGERLAPSLRPPSHNQRWKWVIFRDPWPMWQITQLTHDPHDPWPMAITTFHPTHGTRMGRGMVVLDNPLGLENKMS